MNPSMSKEDLRNKLKAEIETETVKAKDRDAKLEAFPKSKVEATIKDKIRGRSDVASGSSGTLAENVLARLRLKSSFSSRGGGQGDHAFACAKE